MNANATRIIPYARSSAANSGLQEAMIPPSGSNPQEILQQVDPRVGKKALGMKLHAVDRKTAMPDPHHFARLAGIVCPRTDFEIAVHVVGTNDQAVIPRGNEGV